MATLCGQDGCAPAPIWNPPSRSQGTVVNSRVMVVAVAVLFAVVLFILCLHVYAKWFWRNQATVTIVASDGTVHTLSWRRRRYRGDPRVHHPNAAGTASQSVGLPRELVEALPTFEYSREETSLECAVCLEDFEDGEKGRTLPNCNHHFHLDCVDMWLHSHSTCPLCRTGVAGEDGKEAAVVQIHPDQTETPVVGDVGGAFMAAMRASRRRQRSISSPTGLNSLPRTAEDHGDPELPEAETPQSIPSLPHSQLKEYEMMPSVSGGGEARPVSGIRAPFQVSIDIPRSGGSSFVANGSSPNGMSPMARASASFRRLLSRGKSVVAPQSDEGGPSSSPRSSPRSSSPQTPPPPPPPSSNA